MNNFFLRIKAVAVLLMMMSAETTFAQVANDQKVINETAYTIGVAQTLGLKDYLVSSCDVNLDYFASFIKGLKDGTAQANNEDKKAYIAGLQFADQIVNSLIPRINNEVFGDSNIKMPVSEFLKGFLYGLEASEDEQKNAGERAQELIKQLKSQ